MSPPRGTTREFAQMVLSGNTTAAQGKGLSIKFWGGSEIKIWQGEAESVYLDILTPPLREKK